MFTSEEKTQVRNDLRSVYLALDHDVIFEETESDLIIIASHASERWIIGDEKIVHIGDTLEDYDVIACVYDMDQFRNHLETIGP